MNTSRYTRIHSLKIIMHTDNLLDDKHLNKKIINQWISLGVGIVLNMVISFTYHKCLALWCIQILGRTHVVGPTGIIKALELNIISIVLIYRSSRIIQRFHIKKDSSI